MFPMALHLIGLCAVLFISSSSATPLPFYDVSEGSTYEGEFSNSTSFLTTGNISPVYQTTPVVPAHVETIVSRAVNFLEDNMLLITVSSFFILLVLLSICGAIFMSHRRNINAYYPCSFPSKMYVEHSDKTGEAKPFNELPEKPTPEQQSEPVDFHKQLQTDILRAAKSLRTPHKSVVAAEGSCPSQKVADHTPKDSCNPDRGTLDQKVAGLIKEKQQSESTDNGTAAGAGPELNPSEFCHPKEDDTEEPLTGRNVRPSSLLIHNDTATLQLIAGEKTAF